MTDAALSEVIAVEHAANYGVGYSISPRVCTSTDCATTTAAGEARYIDDRVHFSAAGRREIAPWLTGAIQGAVRARDGEGFRD